VNAKELSIIVALLLTVLLAQAALAEPVRDLVRQGNGLYKKGNFNEALNLYDRALVDKPQAPEPKFNKANSFYNLDDLAKAIDLYKEVAAEAKDMKLVTKAKYNMGNCYFQQGSKQKDSNLQKALDDLKTSISYWRQVLDIEPENQKAARNIEVARLMIKDILDQLNKQKDPNQPQDPNQSQQQQQQQQNQQTQSQNQKNQQQDPNQPQDPNQQDKQQQQQKKEQETEAPDATAQQILDKEQRQKQQRQILQRGRYQKVLKDW
jgi:Ca-activated chloride channel family protein